MRSLSRKHGGFTLIELMIVIVVVAILVGIALPSYQQHVIKTKRSLGKAELMEVLARQEQFFVNNRQYATTLAALGLSDPYAIDANGEEVLTTADERIYEISLVSPTTAAFSVRALPQRGQTKDSWCGTLTISSTGVQSETGSAPLAECW
jgi:type IV pilus assembly protein PilE